MENSVLKGNVDIKEWLKAAGIRALKTMAQTILASITVGAAMSDLNWVHILSVAAVAGIASILTSIVGLPEVTMDTEAEEDK